ncbi:zinc finger, CCHC-type containing protein [Tanacetum coccineum]|uniref:Zinc finger, CCHC-type containing protein n=1 Tax=Tanacetum coccineum TaxID=301880 RepID=A0ABQ5CFI3_9ASTR
MVLPRLVRGRSVKMVKETPYELRIEYEKKKLGKNNEAIMTHYNALPRNSQVKDCKIYLLTQQYEKFSILSEETIDSTFTRAKVTAIEKPKGLATLPLDELTDHLKVYEMVLENDDVVSKITKEKVKSDALKAKVIREQTSDDSDKGHFIGECLKYKEKNAFVIGAWSDSQDGYEPQKDATCLMEVHSQEENGQSVSAYILKMKGYLVTLERLGYDIPKELCVSFILNSLNKDYDQFVQNYNMHIMGKSIVELHAMLKLYENGAKGKDKGKNKLAYAPKPKIPPLPKRDNPAKDSVYHHCKEVGHWKRNCPSYQAELKKRKNSSIASTSGVQVSLL